MNEKKLYFIAIIPNLELRAKIQKIKEEVSMHYKAKHALKSPPHITLQMPFKKDESIERTLVQELAQFAAEQHPFNVDLLGFGCFAPRVLYIKVVNHAPITELQAKLEKTLEEKVNFDPKEITKEVHPHVTLATRDLTSHKFHLAWDKYKEQAFNNTFTVNSIFLLKHNGKCWDIYPEFCFNA